MRVAITGPTGSIGVDLMRLHLKAGDEVIAVVNPESKRISNIPKGVEIVRCDISDYKNIFGTNECELFYHLAWAGTGPESRDDTSIQSKNIQYTLDAVCLAKSWGTKKFIGAGSQAEYGPLDQPINRNTPTNPISAYGIAKYASGKLCEIECKKNGIEFNWVRILSVFGKYDNENSLVIYLIDTLLKGERPKMTDCEQIWDLISSEDCARALKLVAIDGKIDKTYVIGSGDSKKLKEYVESIKNLIDPDMEIDYGAIPDYSKQTRCLSADISELIKDTGFSPERKFEDSIEGLIEYRRSHMKLRYQSSAIRFLQFLSPSSAPFLNQYMAFS